MGNKIYWVALTATIFSLPAMAQEEGNAVDADASQEAVQVEEVADENCGGARTPAELGELFGDERFTNNMEKLDNCITTYIQKSESIFGDAGYDAVQAYDDLDEILSVRVELFRRLGARFSAGGSFHRQVQRLQVEIDDIETAIQRSEDLGNDVTGMRETLEEKRLQYEQQSADMEEIRQQFSSVVNKINEYRPTLALQLRLNKVDELLNELAQINEQGRVIALSADEQVNSFIEKQTDGREAQN